MDEKTRQSFLKEHYNLDDLIRIVKQLRAPDGCPWDREQTHESMHDCMIEEAYEVIEAIRNQDMENLKEELGDVLLQVIMHCTIAAETQEFSWEQVVDELAQKLVRRHPHVFGETGPAATAQDGLSRWESIKKIEKEQGLSKEKERGELSRIPKELPPVMRAHKVMKKAGKIYRTEAGNEELLQAVEEFKIAEERLTKKIDEYIKDKES